MERIERVKKLNRLQDIEKYSNYLDGGLTEAVDNKVVSNQKYYLFSGNNFNLLEDKTA